MRMKLLLRTAILLSLVFTVFVNAETTVDDCAVLDIPGERYVLVADVAHDGEGVCFHVAADGVEFDLGAHTITGGHHPTGFQQGILVTGGEATIRNGYLSGFTGDFPWSVAVLVEGSSATLLNLTLSDSLLGVLSFEAEGTLIQQSKINGTSAAVLLCPSDGVVVNDNDLSGNQYGVNAQCGGSGLEVTNNRMRDNAENGLFVWNGPVFGALIEGNRVSGSIESMLFFGLHDSTVSNNNTSENTTSGLSAYWSYGNSFTRNVSSDNRNLEYFTGYGIRIEYSCANVVEDNVTQNNLDAGIVLFESGDSVVRMNRAAHNDFNGIVVSNFGGDPCGGVGNLITRNSTMWNRHGLGVEDWPHIVSYNTSLKNDHQDLMGQCTATTWIHNRFETASDPCIE